jgi:hypothetical protein
MGTRDNAITGENTLLTIQYTLNGEPFDPSSIQKVEIYPSRYDASNNTNVIQTISSGSITHVQSGGLNVVGKFQYTANALNVSQYYYDKIYVVPKLGYAVKEYILEFFVRNEDYVLNPGDIPDEESIVPTIVYFSSKKPDGTADIISGTAQLNTNNVKYKSTIMVGDDIIPIVLNVVNNRYQVSLLDNEGMPAGAYYIFIINDIYYKKRIPLRPSVSFWDLEDVE